MNFTIRALSPPRCRLAFAVSVGLLWPNFTHPVGAQPDAAPIVKPLQPQTVDGVTMRLLKLRWVWPREVWGGNSPDDPNLRMVGYWFDVLDHGKPGQSYLLRQRQIGPLGEALSHDSIFYEASVGWCGMNPRWPKAALEFDLLDRGATPEAAGEFDVPLEFKDVPVPPQGGVPPTSSNVPVERTLTTANGTKVTLLQVAIRQLAVPPNGQRSQPDDLLFFLHWTAPPKHPGAQVQVGFQEGSVQDDTGQDLTRLVPIQGENWLGYDESGTNIWQQVNEGQAALRTHNLPAPQAKKLNVKIWVRETIPSLKQRNKLRQFHFDFDPRRVPFEKKFPVTPIATASTPDCEVALEATKLYSGDNCLFTTTTKDKRPNVDPSWHWFVERWLLTRDQKPLTYDAVVTDPGSQPNFHRDGTPLQDNEWGQTLHGEFLPSAVPPAPALAPGTNAAPPPCDLELQLRAEQLFSRAVDFPALPLPAPGQELKLDRAVSLPDGSRIIARSIHYVKEPGQGDTINGVFSGTDAIMGLYSHPPLQRLEVRVELEPAAGTAAKFYYGRGSTAVDNLGYTLLPERGLNSSGGDNFYLIQLFAPLPGATSFNFHLRCDVARLGESQKLILHGVPMPQEER